MGVLAQHVPAVEQLRPGLVEIITDSAATQSFFGMPQLPSTVRSES